MSGESGKLKGDAGRDRYDAGAGNDTIAANDKTRETIVCGAGKDRGKADTVDRLRGCERVVRDCAARRA